MIHRGVHNVADSHPSGRVLFTQFLEHYSRGMQSGVACILHDFEAIAALTQAFSIGQSGASRTVRQTVNRFDGNGPAHMGW